MPYEELFCFTAAFRPSDSLSTVLSGKQILKQCSKSCSGHGDVVTSQCGMSVLGEIEQPNLSASCVLALKPQSLTCRCYLSCADHFAAPSVRGAQKYQIQNQAQSVLI